MYIYACSFVPVLRHEEHKEHTSEEICEQKFQFHMYVKKNSTNALYRNIL